MSNNNKKASFQGPEIFPYGEHARGGGPGIRVPKTWSSERVPPSSYKTHRHVAASALMPFSSGRTLPSKWVDAERWISSPVSVDNVTSKYYSRHQHSFYSQRRTKSSSGPFGHDGLLSYGSFNTYSPVLGMGVLHGGQWRNFDRVDSSANVGRAPFEDDLVGNCDQGGRKSCPGEPDWLELWSGPLVPSPHGEHDLHNEIHNNDGVHTYDGSYNDEVEVDGIKSRRDMATQMFVAGEMSITTSTVSSPKSMVSTSYSPHPQLEEVCENANQSPESQVKDVQVDEHISTTPKSNFDTRTNYDDSTSNSIVSSTDTKISKQQRGQARIKAWENLQKAKAQAAIQKLEMELEKKRTSLMDKIVEKLKKAEIKAQKMKSSLSKGDDGQIQRHKTSFSKLPLFCRKIRLRSSVQSCSTCYPI